MKFSGVCFMSHYCVIYLDEVVGSLLDDCEVFHEIGLVHSDGVHSLDDVWVHSLRVHAEQDIAHAALQRVLRTKWTSTSNLAYIGSEVDFGIFVILNVSFVVQCRTNYWKLRNLQRCRSKLNFWELEMRPVFKQNTLNFDVLRLFIFSSTKMNNSISKKQHLNLGKNRICIEIETYLEVSPETKFKKLFRTQKLLERFWGKTKTKFWQTKCGQDVQSWSLQSSPTFEYQQLVFRFRVSFFTTMHQEKVMIVRNFCTLISAVERIVQNCTTINI